MSNQKKYKGTENPGLIHSMRERARSSAGSPHDERPNRQRTRSDARRAAIRSSDW